jgi:hypothetical protein
MKRPFKKNLPLFALSIILLLAFSIIGQTKPAQTNDEKIAIEKVTKIIAEIAEKSYPEIKLKKIRVRTFASESNFFKARFSFTRYLTFQKMRHLVYVNPQVFTLNAPAEGIRGILAHELAHVLYYTEKNRLELIGLVGLVSVDFTAGFERKADLEAISRGYGEGLIKYREWLYQNIPAKDLEAKKRDYFSPGEISLIMRAIKQNPDLLNKLKKDVPRNLEETKQRLE